MKSDCFGNALTDFYQLTMASAYYAAGKQDQRARFQLFFRKGPFGEPGAVFAGLALAIEHLTQFGFHDEQLEHLQKLPSQAGGALFTPDFIDFLRHSSFACDVKAIPEGSYVFPHQPLVCVEGPIWQCQIVESALLNIVNFSTLVATKAMRVCEAAEGDPVLEFGLRRAHGPNGALSASRAAFLGGCSGTSNVAAGLHYNIPLQGTVAHSWVMSHTKELEAFQSFASAFPDDCVLLVDTYETIEGVKKAIIVAKEMQQAGKKLRGIRLDSGDLLALSHEVRGLLDQAGFPDVKILASNDLDEERIRQLKRQNAPIDGWGVGTRLVTGHPESALGGVYKLCAVQDQKGAWHAKRKVSNESEKSSLPGRKSVQRLWHGDVWEGDVISPDGDSYTKVTSIDDASRTITFPQEVKRKPLHKTIFAKGKCVYQSPSIQEMKQRVRFDCQHVRKRALNQCHLIGVGS